MGTASCVPSLGLKKAVWLTLYPSLWLRYTGIMLALNCALEVCPAAVAILSDSLSGLQQATHSGESDSRNDFLNDILLLTARLVELDITNVIAWILVQTGIAGNELAGKKCY